MNESAIRWQALYNQVPLQDVPRHFAGIRQSPFMLQYLMAVLERCPRGGRTLETGIGSGHGAIWLSLRGVCAEGIDISHGIIERANQVNNILGGCAEFRYGDLFSNFADSHPTYDVIHSQGVFEHFTTREIRAAIARQVTLADWVVFSVPSVYYCHEPEFGDERLLTLDVWRDILSPFHIEELRYYGDPQNGEREHVLCILRGQRETAKLRALINSAKTPYPPGITGLMLCRNEETRIGDCLKSLSFCDEVIVVDMESTDRTVEIALEHKARVLSHPVISPYDKARMLGAMVACFSHVVVVDADERVPPELAAALREIVEKNDDSFEAMLLPFRHHFAGHWMRCLYPGYTAPRFFKNGKFVFNSRLHSGVQVDGRTVSFPADNPALALVHYSFDSIHHYQAKQNGYTDTEAATMFRDGVLFDWRRMLLHSLEDLVGYYDSGRGWQDGPYGLVYACAGGYYRLLQHAKLFEMRANAGLLQPQEAEVPQSIAEIGAVLLEGLNRRNRPAALPIAIGPAEASANVVWSGPLLDPSGYGEESRNFLFALHAAGVDLRARSIPWNDDSSLMSPAEQSCLAEMSNRPAAPGYTHVIQDFPGGWSRHPGSGRTIVRTMFESDRLPVLWAQACNCVDEVWVPSEFNRRTFIDSGVDGGRIRVIPGCFDPGPYRIHASHTLSPSSDLIGRRGREHATKAQKEDADERGSRVGAGDAGVFTFLSVFDWTLHKSWDVLLSAFTRGFEGRDDVRLIVKTWSTNFYTPDQIRAAAAAHLRDTANADLEADSRIQFVFDSLSRQSLIDLYASSDAFVLPSRGEGWGRIYMEAMALGLPTVGTNWSGNTAFMTAENSWLLDCEVVPVPEAGWREVPAYKGHRWAEPSMDHLVEVMREIAANPEAANARGAVASAEVCSKYSREAVSGQILAALG